MQVKCKDWRGYAPERACRCENTDPQQQAVL